jgi:hypothetical protein
MNRLHISEITSIGAVESGDNDLDDQSILLFKSKSIEPAPGLPVDKEGSMPFDIDTLTDEGKEFVAGLQAQVAALSEEPAALPDDMPDVVKAKFDENDATIAKMQSDNERVSKENAALRDEMATKTYTARAEALAVLLGDPDEVAPVLKALASDSPEAFGKLDAMFDTLIVKDVMAPLFKELGDSASDGSAMDQVSAFTAEIRKNSPDLSPADARAQAWRDHPELKTQAREES